MARHRGQPGGRQQQQSIRGFRPGKEPAHLRKQRAKAQLGSDATWGQKKLVDAIGGKTPDEVRAMMKRWTLILLAAAVAVAVLGVLLYWWSILAGIAAHLLAAVLFFLWSRLRKQSAEFERMAEMLGGGKGGGKRRR